MKRILLLISAASLVFTACNNDKKQVVVTSGDGKATAIVDPGSMKDLSETFQKRGEELQKLAPYTLDQMKAFLPEELAGAKRSKFQANSAMGAAFAEADYTINDSSDIELKIFDCAGPAGAGIYGTQFLGMMSYQSESEDEYTKTIEFQGSKAIEHLNKRNNRASLTWLAEDRLMVTLEGENTGTDLLKKTAADLTLK